MSDDIEVRAREMGWKPQEEFNGPEDKFVSAEEYVERGESILPIVNAHNKKLRDELAELRGQNAELLRRQQASQEAMEALIESHEEDIVREKEKTRKELKAQLREARREGEHDRVDDLEEELEKLDTQATEPKPTKQQQEQAAQLSPDFLAWQSQNAWYGTDLRRTAMANAIGIELRNKAENANLVGTAFWNKVAEEVELTLNPKGRPGPDKVDGGSHGGGSGGGGGSSRSKGYRDLPADAKAVCDRQAQRLVGEGRAFKTKEDWQAHYAAQFFRGEE